MQSEPPPRQEGINDTITSTLRPLYPTMIAKHDKTEMAAIKRTTEKLSVNQRNENINSPRYKRLYAAYTVRARDKSACDAITEATESESEADRKRRELGELPSRRYFL